jgi:hypothetical protein
MTDARLGRIREMVAEGVLDDHVGTLAELLAEVDRTHAKAWADANRLSLGSTSTVDFIANAAYLDLRPALDILDEMAAMAGEPSP